MEIAAGDGYKTPPQDPPKKLDEKGTGDGKQQDPAKKPDEKGDGGKTLDPAKKLVDPDKKPAKKPMPVVAEGPVDLRLVDTLRGHKNNVHWVVFSPDGKTLASSASDHTVILWDLTRKIKIPQILEKHVHQTVICCDIRNDGMMLASAANNVSLWRLADILPPPFVGASIVGLAMSPWASGPFVAAPALVPGRGKIADLRGLGGISFVAFSPDGRRLAGSSSDQTVCVWNPDAAEEPPLILKTTRGTALTGVAWGDNETVFASGADGRIFRWELTQPESPISLQAHKGTIDRADRARIEMLACSADGQTLVTAGHNGYAKLWTRDFKFLGDLRTWGRVYCAAFSPNGKLVATGSEDRLVRVWDLAERKLLAIGEGHDGLVFAINFSPDGLTLASGSHDNTVRLWDVAELAAR